MVCLLPLGESTLFANNFFMGRGAQIIRDCCCCCCCHWRSGVLHSEREWQLTPEDLLSKGMPWKWSGRSTAFQTQSRSAHIPPYWTRGAIKGSENYQKHDMDENKYLDELTRWKRSQSGTWRHCSEFLMPHWHIHRPRTRIHRPCRSLGFHWSDETQ